jgi:hypothetical protein
MRQLSICAIAILLVAQFVSAQSIPTSVQAAEAEGAAYVRSTAPAYTPTAFTSPFTGSVERKCTVQPSTDATNGALRSGEIVMRTRVIGPWGLKADRPHKILWLPLHNPYEFRDTLLIRAVRIDNPADTFRLSVPNWAYGGRAHMQESGFPSEVRFPTAGSWIVIATAGSDWGCFVLPVQPAMR